MGNLYKVKNSQIYTKIESISCLQNDIEIRFARIFLYKHKFYAFSKMFFYWDILQEVHSFNNKYINMHLGSV